MSVDFVNSFLTRRYQFLLFRKFALREPDSEITHLCGRIHRCTSVQQLLDQIHMALLGCQMQCIKTILERKTRANMSVPTFNNWRSTKNKERSKRKKKASPPLGSSLIVPAFSVTCHSCTHSYMWRSLLECQSLLSKSLWYKYLCVCVCVSRSGKNSLIFYSKVLCRSHSNINGIDWWWSRQYINMVICPKKSTWTRDMFQVSLQKLVLSPKLRLIPNTVK